MLKKSEIYKRNKIKLNNADNLDEIEKKLIALFRCGSISDKRAIVKILLDKILGDDKW